MSNITLNYSDCHLPTEIVEVRLFANKVDHYSVNLVVIPQNLENSIGLTEILLSHRAEERVSEIERYRMLSF